MDSAGYPTARELRRIATWPWTDFKGWMDYIHDRWAYADWGWHVSTRGVYRISTAGWSGNESIVEAMMRNFGLWSTHWYSSRCGGHYQFKARKWSKLGRLP